MKIWDVACARGHSNEARPQLIAATPPFKTLAYDGDLRGRSVG